MISAGVRDSLLMRHGGFVVCDGMLDDKTRALLLDEARQHGGAASQCSVPVSDREERGGMPARRFYSAPGGPIQQAFYTAPHLMEWLRELTMPEIQPSGGQATYSYYTHPGDYLAIHRDIVTCEVAVITCLADTRAARSGGMLCVYPQRTHEPLSRLRATPGHGLVYVPLLPGQTVILYGGFLPHAVMPMAQGQIRIVSVLCYQVPEGW